MSAPSTPPPPPTFGLRLGAGLAGILLGALIAGLSSRMPGLVLADLQGGLGFASDDASWLTTAYAAGELAAMPFASWFAITFSLRRFHLTMLAGSLILSAVMPSIHSLPLMIALRGLQGLLSGALIPLLMMAALRFLPAAIRLHGLALYALTATFAPNIALWLAAQCVDGLENWHFVFWMLLPVGVLAMGLVGWGVPRMPTMFERMPQANWLGLSLGLPGLALLVVGLDQGVRLDWLNSPVVSAALLSGISLTVLFLVSEWRHPMPFMRLQLLSRRNLGLGFAVFFLLLMTLSTGVGLPASALALGQGFRLSQTAPLGLVVGLPQLVLGPVVAMFLYKRWVDARWVFAIGLSCIGAACLLSANVTDAWRVHEFLPSQMLQAVGQPMAVVSMLFLATSVVQPLEGPSVSGMVNMLRALGTTCGGALVNELMSLRRSFHAEMLLDAAATQMHGHATGAVVRALAATVAQQSAVLATADVYRVFGALAFLLVPVVLRLQHIPAPLIVHTVNPSPAAQAARVDAAPIRPASTVNVPAAN